MKNNIVKIIGGTILALAVISALTFNSAFAQDQSKDGASQNGSHELVGTWDAQVRIFNCQNNQTIRTFASIGTFMSGGTSIGSTAGIPQALRTPEHGVWSHLRAKTFRFKFKSFSFDAGGNFTGWSIVTHTVQMNAGGDSYTSAGTAEFFDQNGNPTFPFTGCSSTTATRFE
jgi:hypothetical protein